MSVEIKRISGYLGNINLLLKEYSEEVTKLEVKSGLPDDNELNEIVNIKARAKSGYAINDFEREFINNIKSNLINFVFKIQKLKEKIIPELLYWSELIVNQFLSEKDPAEINMKLAKRVSKELSKLNKSILEKILVLRNQFLKLEKTSEHIFLDISKDFSNLLEAAELPVEKEIVKV